MKPTRQIIDKLRVIIGYFPWNRWKVGQNTTYSHLNVGIGWLNDFASIQNEQKCNQQQENHSSQIVNLITTQNHKIDTFLLFKMSRKSNFNCNIK